ncbi:MAG: tRNA 5-methoxyuridine(34)/uridine 5-oxyacetic acid(34) synthase CmoB [Gammaproteobacteria bacterium]
MISFDSFYQYLEGSSMKEWAQVLPEIIDQKLAPSSHGHLPGWYETLEQLPDIKPSKINLDAATVQIGRSEDLENTTMNLQELLRNFIPWRKGPYDLFGIHIDTEWRSDWKWDRLSQHIKPLENKLVLDVGCGGGYHCLRMLGAGAKHVIGIDPGMLSVMQFQAIKHFINDIPVDVLPLGIEDLPPKSKIFDSVFSMGVLYHRRSPIDHLYDLLGCLKPGGELVLETLVIEGDEGQILLPEDRYAQMRNVWFLPTCLTLESWLKRCGYKNIQLIDITKTSTEEQRSTDWMPNHSLANFLDPDDSDKTCEGLPAPRRATLLATAP